MSRIWTRILELGHFNAVPLELLIEGATRYAESLGGAFNATFFFLQNPFDVLAFEFEQSEARVLIESLHSPAPIKVKIFQAEGFLFAEQYGALNHIAEFSDIPRPRIRSQSLEAVWSKPHFSPSEIDSNLLK